MKKKIIPIVVCLVLAACFTLCGCSGESFSKIKVVGKQDTTYIVHGNGGMAVQYGNYVYFINGYAGYDDADGSQNTWPNVVKGGLYRAEFTGERKGNDFVPSAAEGAGSMEFVSSKSYDYENNESLVANVQRIAPKRIGTSGYANGGIFIYDEWVYFASPNNEKNKSGTVQTTKTDFFRAKLDGTDVQKIYTTENTGNESNPYAFYKYNGAAYLVAQDGTDVVSVRVAKKPENKVTIATGVTSVLLPYSQTYYSGMSENTLNHFVYVLRAVRDGDRQKTGNVIEIMRPDGKSGGVYHSQEKTTDALEAVRDGLLFYRTTDNSNNTLIKYDSLHDFLMGNEEYTDENGDKHGAGEVYGDAAYKKEQESLGAYDDGARVQISGTILSTSKISDYTSTYCFRPGGELSNNVYMLGAKSGEVELRSSLNDKIKVLGEGAKIVNVVDDYMYFTGTDANVIYRSKWALPVGSKDDKEQVSGSDVTASGFNGDYCAGYIVYFGKADGLADSYTFFKNVERYIGSEPVLVGKKLSSETLSAPSISVKNRVISWSAVDNADSYTVYRKTGDATLIAAKGITETSYTVDEGQPGEYWVVAATSDGLYSTRSNTVTL